MTEITFCQSKKNFGITNISLFISKGSPDFSLYHSVNEFLDIEEVSPSIDKVFANLRGLIFKVKRHFTHKKSIFTSFKVIGKGTRIASDIPLPDGFEVIQHSNPLFSVLSNSVNLKFILEIELCYIFIS